MISSSLPWPHFVDCQLVEVVVAEELSSWPVHEKVKVQYNELYDTFTRIRRRLEGPRGVTNELFPLLRYVIGGCLLGVFPDKGSRFGPLVAF